MKRKPSEISNIKVEVLASELLDNEFSGNKNEFYKNVDISLLGDERRSYRPEIESFKRIDKEFSLLVNRASLYDNLPELLFHKPKIENDYNLDNIKEGFQKLEQEEKHARKFFKVFDTELINALLAKEHHSKKNEEDKWLEEIWPLPSYFSSHQKSLFWKFLPFIEDIKLNMDHATEFISRILGNPVEIELKATCIETDTNNDLNQMRLGIDSILSGKVFIPRKQINITLVNPQSEIFTTFINSEITQNILKYLVDLVFPADYSLEIELGDIESKSSQIGSDSNCGILGFSLYI